MHTASQDYNGFDQIFSVNANNSDGTIIKVFSLINDAIVETTKRFFIFIETMDTNLNLEVNNISVVILDDDSELVYTGTCTPSKSYDVP